MRFLKSLILAQMLFVGFCFLINGLQAQDIPKGMLDRVKDIKISPEQVVSDMKDKLGISDEQATQILPVIQEQVTAMKENINAMSTGTVTPQDVYTRMQETLNKTNNALAQILTPEQMEKWQGFMHQGQEKANQMMQQGNFSSMPVPN